ncbi:M1 family metallopeptidase [Balneolaceae bacterium YR4-1]|uniref:M1 family metallopeptidase n=1 Tax=Halalkalibaculum roseum TaxID=2709311 RepID=A0A6M1SIL8_9BACT|nr:M1 family metallopeptidase [Halalkalibaculum roseum]NGP75191.1 M1 family metallopeptidase [Halalkalibaculum roseum]
MKLRFVFLFLISSLFISTSYSQGRDYWQQRVEYQMDIDVDAPNHQFTGSQKLTYYNNSPDTLKRVFYHLYFNAFQPMSMMDVRSRTIQDPDRRVRDRIYKLPDDEIGYHKINSLTQNGEAVEYVVDGTILEVTLNEPILPGESTVFEMEFNSQVPRQIRRSGWANAEGVEFSMSQWYPKISEYDEDGWHPNPYIGREFHGVWGDFEVNITIDSSYVIGSTGHLQNPQQIGHGYEEEGSEVERPDSEKLTWRWRAENVHDFMWGADPDYVHTTKQVPNGPMLHFFYQRDPVATNSDSERQEELLANWKQLPEYTAQAFQFMSENFGKYPYDKFSVIQGGDGGMEYPMGTLITGNRSLRSLVGVTVHELIHMWYYAVLATNESRYPWMDEGFTTYASALTMQHLFERPRMSNPHGSSYASYLNRQRNGTFEALDTHADHYHTNGAYGTASYSTGAVFLNQLRYIIGNENFDKGMKRYFEVWKFKHPDGRDFLRVMEEQSGMVLDWYYQYFIESTKTIDYGISTVAGQNDETYVTLKRFDLTPMPIDLMVEYNDGSKELFYMPLRIMRGEKPNDEYPGIERTVKKDWPWVYPTYTLKIDRPVSDIKRLEIDPSQRLADIERDNNVFNVEKKMTEFSTDK